MNSSSTTTDWTFFRGADDTVARRQYRDLIDTVTDGVYHLRSDLHLTAVNDAFDAERIFEMLPTVGEDSE